MSNVAAAQPANNRNQLLHLIESKDTKPSHLIRSEAVSKQFTTLYAKIHGIKNMAKAQAFCEAEQHHFLKIINDNPKIASCTKLSLYGIFMDVAVSGLSFDPTMRHLYIVPFNTNVGTRDNPKWENRAALQISGQGELLLRMMQGQVKYADNPVIVYEGDEFKYGTRDGKLVLDHVACIPRKSNNIIACYLRITRHDDTVDYKVMTNEDIQQLRKFSKDPNSVAWTTGIAGMVQAKTIKHAFKSYPKLRVGEFSKMESETIEEDAQHIDYGFSGGMSGLIESNDLQPEVAPQPEAITPHEEVTNEEDFAKPAEKAKPVATVTHEDDEF